MSLHYTTLLVFTTVHKTALDPAALHYTTLHYTTLHYTTLHYTTQHNTLHYTTLHYTTLHYTTLHYTTLSGSSPAGPSPSPGIEPCRVVLDPGQYINIVIPHCTTSLCHHTQHFSTPRYITLHSQHLPQRVLHHQQELYRVASYSTLDSTCSYTPRHYRPIPLCITFLYIPLHYTTLSASPPAGPSPSPRTELNGVATYLILDSLCHDSTLHH